MSGIPPHTPMTPTQPLTLLPTLQHRWPGTAPQRAPLFNTPPVLHADSVPFAAPPAVGQTTSLVWIKDSDLIRAPLSVQSLFEELDGIDVGQEQDEPDEETDEHQFAADEVAEEHLPEGDKEARPLISGSDHMNDLELEHVRLTRAKVRECVARHRPMWPNFVRRFTAPVETVLLEGVRCGQPFYERKADGRLGLNPRQWGSPLGDWLFDDVEDGENGTYYMGILFAISRVDLTIVAVLECLQARPKASEQLRWVLAALHNYGTTAVSEGGLYVLVNSHQFAAAATAKRRKELATLIPKAVANREHVPAILALLEKMQQLAAYLGMARIHSRRREHHLNPANRPVNKRVKEHLWGGDGDSGNGNVNAVASMAVIKYDAFDDVMSRLGVHVAESFLIIAGKFNDKESKGCNIDVVDSSIYMTVLPAAAYRRLLRVVEAILENKSTNNNLPFAKDEHAWRVAFAPLFPNGLPIKPVYIMQLLTGHSRTFEFKAMADAGEIPRISAREWNDEARRPASPFVGRHYPFHQHVSERTPESPARLLVELRDKVAAACAVVPE